jgi:hypothetical protein
MDKEILTFMDDKKQQIKSALGKKMTSGPGDNLPLGSLSGRMRLSVILFFSTWY